MLLAKFNIGARKKYLISKHYDSRFIIAKEPREKQNNALRSLIVRKEHSYLIECFYDPFFYVRF